MNTLIGHLLFTPPGGGIGPIGTSCPAGLVTATVATPLTSIIAYQPACTSVVESQLIACPSGSSVANSLDGFVVVPTPLVVITSEQGVCTVSVSLEPKICPK